MNKDIWDEDKCGEKKRKHALKITDFWDLLQWSNGESKWRFATSKDMSNKKIDLK